MIILCNSILIVLASFIEILVNIHCTCVVQSSNSMSKTKLKIEAVILKHRRSNISLYLIHNLDFVIKGYHHLLYLKKTD